MHELEGVIDDAVKAGLVEPQSAGALAAFLLRRGVSVPALAADGDVDDRRGSDREYPRFVRGFHDILITIGIVAGLVGLLGVASHWATFPVIIVLSEILVKRQRLALPAVVLAAAFLANLTVLFNGILPDNLLEPGAPSYFLAIVAMIALGTGLYHWRYRTPVAAALTVATCAAFLLGLLFEAIRQLSGDTQILTENPKLVFGILCAAALGLFGVALSFDFRDPARVTTRSDIAFWLHLMAAPAILYSLLIALDWNVVAIACVLVLMTLIGLIIDRRTFITAGLVSLGYLIYAGIGEDTFPGGTTVYGTLAAVGAIVLIIGTLWAPLRRLALGPLPASWRAYLAPA